MVTFLHFNLSWTIFVGVLMHNVHFSTGGFGGNVGHDAHMLYTLSAIQILAMFDSLDKIDKEKVVQYILKQFRT